MSEKEGRRDKGRSLALRWHRFRDHDKDFKFI